jgi:hypothetical protein
MMSAKTLRCLASVELALLVVAVHVSGQQSPPLTVERITKSIGSEADAQAVVSLALADEFRPRGNPPTSVRREYFLGSHFRAEWLPDVDAVEFVLLTDEEAGRHISACGQYWEVEHVSRSSDTVSFQFGQRCGGRSKIYTYSLRAGQWRLGPPDLKEGYGWAPGIGSGITERERQGCPCLR